MYVFLDYFFMIFHGSLSLFNLTGWIFPKTRRLHLYIIGLTFFSWIGLGAFYGWGYCPSTDWHWQVKQELGERNLPDSYIKYYADKITGIEWNPFIVDMLTLSLGLSALILSVLLNRRDQNRRKL